MKILRAQGKTLDQVHVDLEGLFLTSLRPRLYVSRKRYYTQKGLLSNAAARKTIICQIPIAAF